MLDRSEERQERNQILIVCFLLNFNGFSWELSSAMISADAPKFSMHFSAEAEFGLGAEDWR